MATPSTTAPTTTPTPHPAPTEKTNLAISTTSSLSSSENVLSSDSGEYWIPSSPITAHCGPHWKDMYRRLMRSQFQHYHLYHPTWLPRGSTIAAGFNIATASIGVGTLSMPIALQYAGVIPFIISMLFVFFLALNSLRILGRCCDLMGVHSMELMSRKAFGHRFEVFTEVVIILMAFGSGVAYIVIIGDLASSVMESINPNLTGLLYRTIFQGVVFVAIMFPLTLLRSLERLKLASIVGIAAISILVISILVHGIRFGEWSNLKPIYYSNIPGLFQSLTMLLFALDNQVNVVEIYGEMHDRSVTQLVTISLISVGSCVLAYFAVSFSALAEFGTDLQGNVLQNFTPGDDVLITAAYAGIAIKTILTFPFLIYPCREALFHMIGTNLEDVSAQKWLIYSVAITFPCWGLAVVVPSVTTLFGLIGATTGALLMFILPALYALKTPAFWETSLAQRTFDFVICWTMLIVGVVGGIAGTIFSVLPMIFG